MNETALIQNLKQGNEEAFKWLVDTWRAKVFNTILNIVQDHAEAEDAAQEVFIKVYETIHSFKQDASLATWIYRIAVNKATDKLRRRKTRHQLHKWLPFWMPEEKRSADATFHHPGILMEQKEKAALLFKAINALPENQKIAFTLIKVQGMKYDEVSEIMQIGIKAIESLVSRAKQNLQQQLQQLKDH